MALTKWMFFSFFEKKKERMLRTPAHEPRAGVLLPNKVMGSEFKGSEKKDKQRWYSLYFWHIVAAVLHLLSFAAILAVFLVRDTTSRVRGAVYTDVWNVETGTVSYAKLGDGYELTYVILTMTGLTGLIHIYQAVRCYSKRESAYKRNARLGINRTRWSEYSVTAALMTWVLCQLCGITNLYVLLAVAIFGNILLQWQGYYFEVALADRERLYMDRSVDPVTLRFNVAVPMLRGFLIFFFQWAVITISFVRTVGASTQDVPWFVWSSFFGIFFMFLGFPAIQILYANKKWIKDWYWYEWFFILLSLVSKLFLDWTLFGATF